MASKKAKYAIGIGGGLVGAFLLYRWWLKDQAQRRLDELRAKVIAGEIPTRRFLEAILIEGQPNPGDGPRITVEEAARMKCELVFPTGLSTLPEFSAALNELRRNGTCL
jgi:hypothetical protein